MRQVAVVPSGRKRTHGGVMSERREWEEWDASNNLWVKAEDWLHIPLYSLMSDRVEGEQVYCGHDATDPLTLLAIYSVPNFPTVVLDYVQSFHIESERGDGSDLVNPECNSGCHRASTYGHTFTEVLNSLEDGRGKRLYNAQLFALTSYSQRPAMVNQVNHAVEWTTRENARVMAGGATDRSTKFGYNLVCQRAAAEKHFNEIWDWVDDFNAEQTAMARQEDREAERQEDREAEPAETEPSQSAYLAPIVPSAAPMPASPVQRQRSRSPFRPRGLSAKATVLKAKLPKPPSCPPPGQMAARESRDTKIVETRPPWAEITSDTDVAECWWDVLNDAGVDETAMKGLFGLAQSSEQGRYSAFGIMAKLWKKHADGESIARPSAFVWKCVKNTWDGTNWS